MTIEELSQHLSAYIDQKVEEVKLQLFYNPNSRVAAGLSEFEDKEMKQYSGFEYLKHETMRMLVRNLAKLGVDGFGKEKIETLTALDSTDSPGGYSLVLEDPHPVLGVAEAALLILPVNDSDKERLQIAFFIEGEQLRISSRNGSYLFWGDWAKSNDIGKSIVAGDYDNLRERFIGQGLHQHETSNLTFDNFKCVRYRNLEANLMLPAEDYEGRTYPLETAIVIAYKTNDSDYVLANVPYVADFVKNPGDWMTTNYMVDAGIGAARRLSFAEYVDDITVEDTTYTNCLHIQLVNSKNLAVGTKMTLVSFVAYGLADGIRWDRAVPRNPGVWTQTGCQCIWKCSDGTFRGIFNTDGRDIEFGINRWRLRLYSTDDMMNGVWTCLTQGQQGVFDSLTTETIKSIQQNVGIVKYPGRDGVYITPAALTGDPSGAASIGLTTGVGFVVFDEYMRSMKLIQANINYEELGWVDTNGPYCSLTFYRGLYFLSIHQGNYFNGKRLVFTSKTLEGEFNLNSTIFDYGDEIMTAPGTLFTASIANGVLFPYNGELYYFSSGSSKEYSSGSYQNHELYLWKFNDYEKSWNLISAPIMVGAYSWINYQELGDLSWAWDHVGMPIPCFVEGNKLWLAYTSSGNNNEYQASVGYIDLDKALS